MLIRRIWSYPRWLHISADDSVEGIARGTIRERFTVLLGSGEVRSFPITVGKSELLDPDSKVLAPFIILVSWRKTQSVWLPQFPRIIFSSARTLRQLRKAK